MGSLEDSKSSNDSEAAIPNAAPNSLDLLQLLTSQSHLAWHTLQPDPETFAFLSSDELTRLHQLEEQIAKMLEHLGSELQLNKETLDAFTSDDVDVNVSDRVKFTFLQHTRKRVQAVLTGCDIDLDRYPAGDRLVYVEESLKRDWCEPAEKQRQDMLGKKDKKIFASPWDWQTTLQKRLAQIDGPNAQSPPEQSEDRRMMDSIVTMICRQESSSGIQDNLYQAALGIRWCLKKTDAERKHFFT